MSQVNLLKIGRVLLAGGLLLSCGDSAPAQDQHPVMTDGGQDQQALADSTPAADLLPAGDSGADLAGDLAFIPGSFGQLCSSSNPCELGLHCFDVAELGAAGGFCTQACSVRGAACSGAPAESKAFCALEMTSGTFYCAFLCQSADGVTLACPPELVCSEDDLPAGSGQHFCIPPWP